MVGSNRIVAGCKIVNPLGSAELGPQEEKELRRTIVEKALEALQSDVQDQTLYDLPAGERS
jgi:glycine reductase complex component B subunit gamma